MTIDKITAVISTMPKHTSMRYFKLTLYREARCTAWGENLEINSGGDDKLVGLAVKMKYGLPEGIRAIQTTYVYLSSLAGTLNMV